MTDRDVDAWARERLANSQRIAAERTGADRTGWLEDVAHWQDIVANLTALAEARQQLAKQAEETTRERTWCRVVASQLKEAQRQLAAQAQEIAKLKQEASEHLDYMSQASTAVREIQDAQRERDAQAIPTNWCNALLTGPNAVIGEPPYSCNDIERLLRAVRSAIRAARTTAQTDIGPKAGDGHRA